MLKLLICDGDGTIGYPTPSAESRDLFALLPDLGIQLAVASNGSKMAVQNHFKHVGLEPPGIIVTRAEIGKSKPSPEFVQRIRDLAGVELREIAYVGDDDMTDILCAINAHVLPFAGHYSVAPTAREMQYGIPVLQPKALGDYLSTFGRQDEPYFGWHFISDDTNGRPVDARALIYDHGWFTDTLKRVLKEHQDERIGSNNVSVSTLLLHYLVSQCYMSGLVTEIDWVGVYPGHLTNSTSPELEAFSDVVRHTFNKSYKPNLLVRHTDAPESKRQGSARNIIDQLNTIHVNPDYRDKIQGKRILILDDFTTAGFSFETARQMLLRAGAQKITCLAIGKYRATQTVSSIKRAWDPFAPVTFRPSDVILFDSHGRINSDADAYFKSEIWPVYSA